MTEDAASVDPIISGYDDPDWIASQIAAGRHRDIIGGMWEEIGRLQAEFLKRRGLKPEHRLVDVGCGSFRAGVHLAAYLEPGRYYGIDIRPELIEAGYQNEIVPAGLDARLPRSNLHATGRFDLSPFATRFDYAMAQSVFTHLPVQNLSECLTAIAPFMKPGGEFYATYFLRPDEAGDAPLAHDPGGVTTYPDRNPFDYTAAQLHEATTNAWTLIDLGDWDHPRDQRMALFIRKG